MRVGIVVFPGSNCGRDVHHVLQDTGHVPSYMRHEGKIPDYIDALILLGGSCLAIG